MTGQQKARLRAEMLRLINRRHEKQDHRYDDVTLTGVLKRLGHDVYVNLVRTLLQDMRERNTIAFEEIRNDVTGVTLLEKIQICPRGRDILEGRDKDAAFFFIIEPEDE